MQPEIINKLESLLEKQVIYLNDLLCCFEDERQSLSKVDTDQLWCASRCKEGIADKLLAVKDDMLSLIQPDIREPDVALSDLIMRVPSARRPRLQRLYIKLTTLENEVALRRMENKAIINESIAFLDDMIAVLTGNAKGRETYDKKCHLKKAGTPLLLYKEA